MCGKIIDNKQMKEQFYGGENMNEWIVARINSLKEDLSKKQEYFKINIQNMDSPTYEDNTINDLLVMKKLKTEIEQLELMLQMNEIFTEKIHERYRR